MKNEYFDEKQHRRNKGIFYATISIVTLVIAIIGASFSYFIASTNSVDSAIDTGSTSFSLIYEDDFKHLLNPDLIPAANNVAYYAAAMQDYATEELYNEFEENKLTFDKTRFKNTKCRDDNGNAVCSIYTFTITNPASAGVPQTLNFRIIPIENTFGNLYLMVRDASVETDENTKTGIVVNDFHLGDNLEHDVEMDKDYYDLSALDSNQQCSENCMEVTLESGESATYQMILYIKNLEDVVEDDNIISSGDQTAADSNKNFIASVMISPKNGSGQIFGVIDAASGKFGD